MELARTRRVTRYVDGRPQEAEDDLVAEHPIEIRLGGTPLAVLMCSPGMESELALGFALTEGILLSPDELTGVRPVGDGDRFELELAPGVQVDPEQFKRNAYTTSSCGVCGKASIDAVRIASRPVPDGPVIPAGRLATLPGDLRELQSGFEVTGGLHAAALFEPDGRVIAFAEDVGRHNAVDKAIGAAARHRWPLGELILQVSGRISFEITQKAAVAGLPIVAGVSAASSLAVELGDDLGLTVAGFVRDGSFVVYCGERRLAG
jgi:FdhD protein